MIFPSCSHVKKYLEVIEDNAVSEEYFRVLNFWTREETIYSQFETKARIVVTLKSREFSQAYLGEFSRLYLLDESEIRQREDAQIDLASDFTEFLFYAYTPVSDWNDFSERDSVWKILLITDAGERFEPLEVRNIEDPTPLTLEFFPYVKPYHGRFYTLKFPSLSRQDAPYRLELVFTSVFGKAQLRWD